MSKTLSGAIIEVWKGTQALMQQCPQIWYNEVPEFDEDDQLVQLPFIRFVTPTTTPEWNFESATGGGYHEFTRAVFTCYATSSEQADDIIATIKATLDWHNIMQVAQSQVVGAMRVEDRSGSDEVRDRQGNFVPNSEVEYQFMIVKGMP
jgi:hypothetical protein